MKEKLLGLALCALLLLTACTPTGEDLPLEFTTTVVDVPVLTVQNGTENITVSYFGCSWSYLDSGGEWQGIAADAVHPLECQEILTPITAQGESVALTFDIAPDEVSAECWSDENFGDPAAAPESAPLTENTLAVQPGGYVYEVTAKWNSSEEYGGEASYYLYILSADTGHTHAVAQEAQTVAEPISGYCGNTQAWLYIDGEEYTLSGSEAICLTDILINLAYDAEKLCSCEAEYGATEDSSQERYEISLSQFFARSGGGQADLTQEQADCIRSLIESVE